MHTCSRYLVIHCVRATVLSKKMNSKSFISLANIVTVLVILTEINGQGFNFHLALQPARPCRDPDNFDGVCKSIKQCPAILTAFLTKSTDASFIQYIKQSNENCAGIKPFICCPPDGRKFEIPEASIKGRLLSPNDGCGFSNQELRVRYTGNKQSRLGAFPWMALVGYTNNKGETSWQCGGSLITTRHVLTAARCIAPNLSKVRLGEHNIESRADRRVQDINIIGSESHPNFNIKDGTNDIAILYLDQDVDISPNIRPICLPISEPLRSRSFINYTPFVAGWGRLQEGGKPSNVMLERQMIVLDNNDCRNQYRLNGKLKSEKQFGNGVICAGESLNGGKGDCQSDTGGPLMQPVFDRDSQTFRYYQTGIVSYGIGCQQTNTPGVYTNVQHFVDWIQDKIK